jgi:hypothetical protein
MHIWMSRFSNQLKKTPWPESASELYRLSDHSLSAQLVPTFADRGWHVVSVADPFGRIIGFLDRTNITIIKITFYFNSLTIQQLFGNPEEGARPSWKPSPEDW